MFPRKESANAHFRVHSQRTFHRCNGKATSQDIALELSRARVYTVETQFR